MDMSKRLLVYSVFIILMFAIVQWGVKNSYNYANTNKISKIARLKGRMFALHKEGKKKESLKVAENIFALIEARFTHKDMDYIEALHSVGWLHSDLKNYKQAEEIFNRTLLMYQDFEKSNNIIITGTHGPGNEYVLLANIYFDTGRMPQAEKYYIEAINYLKRISPHQDWYLRDTYITLGRLIYKQGRIEEGRQYLELAKQLRDESSEK